MSFDRVADVLRAGWAGAAANMKFVIALIYRNWAGKQTLSPFALVRMVMQPAIFLFVFGHVLGSMVAVNGSNGYAAIMAPGMIAIATVSAPFVSTASYITSGFYFRSMEGWLLAPVSLRTLAAAMIVGGVMNGLVNALVVAVLAWLILGLVPHSPFYMLVMILFGSLLFSLVSLLLLLLPQRPTRGQEIFSFLMMPMSFFGCTFYAYSMLSPPLNYLALVFPTTYISEGLRAAYMQGGQHMDALMILGGLCASAAVLLPCVDWVFRRRLGHFTW